MGREWKWGAYDEGTSLRAADDGTTSCANLAVQLAARARTQPSQAQRSSRSTTRRTAISPACCREVRTTTWTARRRRGSGRCGDAQARDWPPARLPRRGNRFSARAPSCGKHESHPRKSGKYSARTYAATEGCCGRLDRGRSQRVFAIHRRVLTELDDVSTRSSTSPLGSGTARWPTVSATSVREHLRQHTIQLTRRSP